MSKPILLVVEDEAHLREVLRFQLEAAGYEVLTAEDGPAGLAVASEHLPDLVLLDVMMPGLDGYEVCRRLRASFATRQIPIIMLTAKTELEDKVHGLEDGANDYVTKPWDQKELLARIHNLIEWGRQQRAASPLTGLPGNITIEAEIQRRLSEPEPFALLLIDIDYFKAFNDHYGYARGDLAIQRLAQTLVTCSERHGGAANFVGHIGGDDFMALTACADAESLGADLLEAFGRQVPELYDPADYRRGHVEVRNRRHELERFPLMSLTIAVVSTDRMPVSHLAQLIDIAQELKVRGKDIQGSVVVNDRRGAEPDASSRQVA